MSELLGQALIDGWEARHGHGRSDSCPVCREKVSTVGIIHLVYTFETCECGEPEFAHLIETLWHKECFSVAPCQQFSPFWVRGTRGREGHYTKECVRCGRTEVRHP